MLHFNEELRKDLKKMKESIIILMKNSSSRALVILRMLKISHLK